MRFDKIAHLHIMCGFNLCDDSTIKVLALFLALQYNSFMVCVASNTIRVVLLKILLAHITNSNRDVEH